MSTRERHAIHELLFCILLKIRRRGMNLAFQFNNVEFYIKVNRVYALFCFTAFFMMT